MKPIHLVAASGLALGLAACGPKVPVARTALECPATQGDLKRTSASADGKTCTYVSTGGAEVTLQLVSLQGNVDSTLSAIEANLLAGRTPPKPEDKAQADGAKGADASTTADEEQGDLSEKIDRKVDQAVKDAMGDTKQSGVDVEITRDGKRQVTSRSDGETHVNLPGIHIVANDKNDSANVKIGPLSVEAGGDGETVRLRRDVRMRGEALNPERRGVRATFIYTGHDLPDGYRFVGYEAGGPKTGPITVAVVKSKSRGPDGDELYPGVKKLVRLNGGV